MKKKLEIAVLRVSYKIILKTNILKCCKVYFEVSLELYLWEVAWFTGIWPGPQCLEEFLKQSSDFTRLWLEKSYLFYKPTDLVSHRRSILPLLHIRWVILATICVCEPEPTVVKPTVQLPTRFSKIIHKNHFAGSMSNKGKESINVEVPCITQQILKSTPSS